MEKKYYKVVVKTVNEMEDTVKARTLWQFRMSFSPIFASTENVHLVFNYIECQNSYYRDKLGTQTFMPVVVYLTEEGVFDAFTNKRLEFDLDFIKFDEVTPLEFAKYRNNIDKMSAIMYPETINELIGIIHKSKFQFAEESKKFEDKMVRKRARNSRDTFANRFKNKVRSIFDNTSQK